MIDPKRKLIAVLGNVQEYLDLAASTKDRGGFEPRGAHEHASTSSQ